VGFAPTFYFERKTPDTGERFFEVMERSAAENRIQELAAEAAADNGVELVHIGVKGSEKQPTVTVFIDKEGGVTHEDCSKMSHRIGDALDAEDLISSAYVLEVSSPGLERELYSLTDFAKFAGSLAKVKVRTPVNGQRNFRGRITGVDGDEVVFADLTAGEVRFPFEDVAKANLEIDLEAELSRAKK
jgi:ribosome maturation factor RimP